MDFRQSDSVTEHASFHRSPPSLSSPPDVMVGTTAAGSQQQHESFFFFFYVYRAKVITEDVAAVTSL